MQSKHVIWSIHEIKNEMVDAKDKQLNGGYKT